MSPSTKNVWIGYGFALLAVVALCTSIRIARADGPSKADLQNLEDIIQNQKVLEENREAHERFMQAKAWNEAEVRELNRNGWNVNWQTMQLVPFQPGMPSSPKQAKARSFVSFSNAKDSANRGGSRAEYVWSGAPDYKNDRLRAYQRMLKARGITNPEHLKLLTAQLIQENGALSESKHGDGGCSVGILQYNACVHHKMSAVRFLEKHPEWKSWEYQLERMADMVADRYQNHYSGDIKRVIVHHNAPVYARRNRDTPAGYFRSVSSRTSLLAPL